MPFFRDKLAPAHRSTSCIHRAFGGIADVREVRDRTSQIEVIAFPIRFVSSIICGEAAFPACYALADRETIYFGETNNAARRLSEHSNDPQKSFACEVFLIRGVPGFRFGKQEGIFLQHRLTEAADKAALMTVLKGAPPRMPDIEAEDEPLYERLLEDSRRLLFDAGCRALSSNLDKPMNNAPTDGPDDPVDIDDGGQMEIGITPPRADVTEYTLIYDETIWARGYHAGDKFVVGTGSDFRVTTNPSCSPINQTRRQVLAAAGVLTPIPGAEDRRRLTVDVGFPSMAIAAKCICGAHIDSSKWRAVDQNQRPAMRL